MTNRTVRADVIAVAEGIYHRLGTKPVINALGIYTDLGGSRLSPEVWRAMEEANESFARFPELLEKSGDIIASWLGSEAARVTPGASAGIVMSIAACMTGNDAAKTEQLPDTTGMRQIILMQKRQRYKYDRMVRMTGANLVEVGNVNGTDDAELATAISDDTAAVFIPAHLDQVAGVLPLETVVSIAHGQGIPVIVDAAYMNYPVELMSSYTRLGADLVIFSAKYFGGPNTGGIVCGRADLIEAVALVDFTRFEASKHLSLGRPFKLDRQLVVGVVLALQEWLEMNHEERFAKYSSLVDQIAGHLETSVPVRPMSFTMQETLNPEPVNCLFIGPLRPGAAETISRGLAEGDPSILVHVVDDALVVDVECVSTEEAKLVGERLNEEIRAAYA